jgi:hypothetical protein
MGDINGACRGIQVRQGQLISGITTELDVIPGLYNIGTQWIASGVIEWARQDPLQ